MTRHWGWMALVVCLLALPAKAQIRGATGAWPVSDSVWITRAPVAPTFEAATSGSIEPLTITADIGSTALLYYSSLDWSVNPTVGELTAPALPALTSAQQAAVDLAPDWMKAALARNFFELDESLGDELATMITSPEDERYTDELAFTVAYGLVDDLERMVDAVALLTENVAQIYAADEKLDYVEIVEQGTVGQGDYGTTLRYNVQVGAEVQQFEIPLDVYYWNVVHPRLSDEPPDYIKPSTGGSATPENGGQFWRSYLPYDVAGSESYGTPMYLQDIDPADLQDLNPSAPGYLRDLAIHNLEIAYSGPDTAPNRDQVVFAEYAYGSGEVYVTTLRLEEAYAINGSQLLEQLLDQGNGDVLLPADAPIALIHDSACVDYETALTALGRWDDVTELTSTDLAGYDETAWTTFKSTYKKVVVPAGQPLALWEVLAGDTVKAQLEAFTGNYGILEMHVVPAADAKAIEDLTLPTNFGYTAADIDEVTVYGRPKLFDMLAGKDILWDGQVWGGLSGDRSLWDDPDALQTIGNWVGKNMLDNIEERWNVTGASPERSVQPSRIVYNHFGNCGELQDLIGAAMRTALIPGLLVTDINEDHVWNEFYHEGEWLYFQDDWSNAATRIASPGGGQDVDYGGGKNISFILAWWGNGEVTPAIERYSNTITLNFHVTDANGDPVPDAQIDIYSEAWQTTSLLVGYWVRTDADGRASVPVGDLRNYHMHIDSSIGEYPEASGAGDHVEQIVDAADAVSGATFNIEHQFDVPLVQVTTTEAAQSANDSLGLHVQLAATGRYSSIGNPFSGTWSPLAATPPLLDVFLVNEDNLQAARNNDPFTAAYAQLGVAELDEVVYPPTDETWHLLVSHHSARYSDHLLDLNVTVEGEPWQPGDDDTTDDDDDDGDDESSGGGGDDDDDDSGCGC